MIRCVWFGRYHRVMIPNRLETGGRLAIVRIEREKLIILIHIYIDSTYVDYYF